MNKLLDLIGALLYLLVFPIIVLVNCLLELIVALKYLKTSAHKKLLLLIRQMRNLPPVKHKPDLGKLLPWKFFHR